jgi:CheY-specific phosphatase CheX
MSKRITAEQLNAFVVPAVEVLEKLGRISAQVGTLRRECLSIPLDGLVIVIGIDGDLVGKVVFLFDPPIFVQILNTVLGPPVPLLTDPICWDAMAEVANMIVGNATGRMETLGLRVNINPPQILTWKEVSRWMPDNEGIVIPLKCNLGEIGIAVFLQNL